VLTRKKKFICLIALAPLPVLLITGTAILYDGLTDKLESADVAIVLGSAVNELGVPSPRLQARLDKAVELYNQHLFPTVLVSGGIDPRGHDEAQIMSAYLRARGIPGDRILVDSGGSTTWLTAQNAQQILHDHNLNRAMVITQYFHITRTKLALRHFGIQCVAWAHANRFEWRDIYSMGRETLGYYSYLLSTSLSYALYNVA
jgi:vancomycin permeability regulator SanA